MGKGQFTFHGRGCGEPQAFANILLLKVRRTPCRRAGEDLIVSKIKSSKCAFRLDTKDMIELKSAGLSDHVIAAMMEKAQ